MRIGTAESFVAFDFKEAMPADSPRSTDVACSIDVSCHGFNGLLNRVWFASDDIAQFLSELQALGETRQGSVALLNLSSTSDHSPLRFEIFSTDQTGHLAVRASLLKVTYVGDNLCPLNLSVAFAIDAGDFPSIVGGFRRLFSPGG
jgi:hypothetical protein